MASNNGRPLYFIEVDGNPVGVHSMNHWYSWREEHSSDRVAYDVVGDWKLSTVFLGIDHAYGDGPPVLYETMLFHKDTGGNDHYCKRYSTRSDAAAGHAEKLAELLAATAAASQKLPVSPRPEKAKRRRKILHRK